MKGLTVRCTADWADRLKGMGMEPVVMPVSEAYVSMQKGILDAGWLTPGDLKTLRLAELVKSVSKYGWFEFPIPKGQMNLDTYNSLPPDIQKIIDDSGEYWEETMFNEFAASDQAGIEFGQQQGVKFFDLSEEDIKKSNDMLAAVAVKAAADLDAQGLPGTEIYKETRRLIEEYSK
jgi:TRAP-type C4-dicarboxylate transport system substrate-binding protein